MKTAVFGAFALVGVLAVGPVFAHHPSATLGRVTITQPAKAGGQTIAPGTYEIRLTGNHLPGGSEAAPAEFEIVSNGSVVAKDFAEVVPGDGGVVGTTGGALSALRVQRLRGDEFLRISASRDGERYLIHLSLR